MRKTIIFLAVFVLSAGLLYAGTGNLIVDGNLGIGTTTPQYSLDAAGSIRVDNNTAASVMYMQAPAVNSNAANYFKALDLYTGIYNIPAGVTDSGYRVGLGVEGFVNDPNFGGTLAYQYGVWARNGSYASGGTIQNSYGVYIDTVTQGTTTFGNLYGLYQDSPAAQNYFAGNVGVGKTAPRYQVDVQGDVNVSGNFRVNGLNQPMGAVSGLKIVNDATSPSTTVDLSVSQVGLANASSQFVGLTNLYLVINSTVSGANGVDVLPLAQNTWYAVFVIWNPSTATAAGLLSTSATSPALPSGYTYQARVGWVRTDGTANAYLLRTLQYGRNAQYVVTSGSNTANLPLMASGTAGNVSTPTWVAVATGSFVPPTAAIISGTLTAHDMGYLAILAPNSSYGQYNSSTNPPWLMTFGQSGQFSSGLPFDMILESANIYWATNGPYYLFCFGWQDNL